MSKVHDRADRLLGIGHRRPQLLALFDRQRLEDVGDDALRQVGCQVGQFVGIERLGRRHQLGALHRLDQRLAHGIRDFEQDFAFALGLDQIPGDQTLIERQRFEDVGDVRRVHGRQLGLQFVQMLLVNDVLDQIVARPFLPMHQILDQLVPGKQHLHLGEALLQVFGVGDLVFFAHGAVPQRGHHSSTRQMAGFLQNQGTSAAGMRARMIAVLRASPGALRLRS
jgi:hypothetical protein